MTVGDRIKYFRDNKGMTQDELANKIGTTKQTIYKYENNIITNIPSDKIELIAYALEVNPVVLMGWDRDFAKLEQHLDLENYKANARNNMDESTSIKDKCDAKIREYLALYARSSNASKERGDSYHPDFETYVSMMLKQKCQKERMPNEVYEKLVARYGTLNGINEAQSYWYPKYMNDDSINTIAAHHDSEDWTEEELNEIEEFKKFVLSKRNNPKE